MTSQYQDHLKYLERNTLRGICHGIEREGLRVTPSARLAQTSHPEVLGKALTHPYITTDYSEALLEFITPVHRRIEDTFAFLEELHVFTSNHMDDEYLWAGSMPAYLEGDTKIPIARYGKSNIGQMKYIYRKGLAHRYGKAMQTIAGIHYNFSLPSEFWQFLPETEFENDITRQSAGYMALIRNFRRYSWLLMYLFGASPAISRSFFPGDDTFGLEKCCEDTLYSPYATSLRMGDFGYTNNAQSSLNICYNSLDDYIESLTRAINTPYQPYESIGLKHDGEYLQLNTNILQIENEYYSTIRPKRIARSGEKPVTALKHHGIEYIEVRCLDINPFEPLGISSMDAHFQDVFLVYCALHDQSEVSDAECKEGEQNFNRVVTDGRSPGVTLQRHGQSVGLQRWGIELLEEMRAVAVMLDQANDTSGFTQSLEAQQEKLEHVELTPSAQVLAAMKDRGVGYVDLMLLLSQEHSKAFLLSTQDKARLTYFNQVAERSRVDQQAREHDDEKSFDEFLSDYIASE